MIGSRNALTANPVGMSQSSSTDSCSCDKCNPAAFAPRIRSEGVEAVALNQAVQPRYVTYRARGTAEGGVRRAWMQKNWRAA